MPTTRGCLATASITSSLGPTPRRDPASVNTVYLGTSEFAATVLRRLAESPHRPSLVVTPPHPPRGRGRQTAPPPAAQGARGLPAPPPPPSLPVPPPARPRGRGRKPASPPAAEVARELGLELLQAKDVNAEPALERIRAAGPQGGGVCAFGQLIREPRP